MAVATAPAKENLREGPHRVEVEPTPRRVRVVFNGETIADSKRAVLLRESNLLPVYYFPPEDVRDEFLEPTDQHTRCPYKGEASYWKIRVGDRVSENTMWGYLDPLPGREDIRGYRAFYWNRMDAWYEEDQEVRIDPVTDAHVHGNPLVDWLMRDAWEAASISELVIVVVGLAAAIPPPPMNA